MSLRATVAGVFRAAGKGRLARAEFRNVLSLRLGWFAPREADRVLARAIAEGEVRATDGDAVEPAFDVGAVEVALDFRPDAGLAEDAPLPRSASGEPEPADTRGAAVHRACLAAGKEPAWVQARVNEEQERVGSGLLAVEVAALLVAKRLGADVRDLVERERAKVRAEGTGAVPATSPDK